MLKESAIAYENPSHWVLDCGAKGFEVYRAGITHSTRCAIVGWQGERGLARAVAEADRRHVALAQK